MVAIPIPDVKSAIEAGDADALRDLLARDPARANQLIEWGKNGEVRTHPLHFVSDMRFDGTLQRDSDLPLVEALLEAGADPNHHAANGETPLIGAASLNAEEVGLTLLDAGARPESRGIFDATPLHWAAIAGLQRLVARLIFMGVDLNLLDTRYNAPPVGWAIYGHLHLPPTSQQASRVAAVRLLISAGATVRPEWLADSKIRSHPALLAALSSS